MTVNLPLPSTGRGAWTERGGTATIGKVHGYYAFTPPHLVGLAGTTPDPTQDDYAVMRGVRQIQQALNWWRKTQPSIGAVPEDGVYGQVTASAVAAFQKLWPRSPAGQQKYPADPSGAVGRATARLLFSEIAAAYARPLGVPEGWTAGIMELEALYDPGAVGGTTPQDMGLAQWRTNLQHGDTFIDMAYATDVFTALRFLAATLQQHQADTGHWLLAVAAHHAPAWEPELAALFTHLDPGSGAAKLWRYLAVVANHVS
jgi:hypothetical protein